MGAATTARAPGLTRPIVVLDQRRTSDAIYFAAVAGANTRWPIRVWLDLDLRGLSCYPVNDL